MYLRKLCLLSEHLERVLKHIGDTPITVRAYKYHTEIVWFSLIPYPNSWFNDLQIPLVLKQENNTASGEVLYDSKHTLVTTHKLSSVKTNWKQQHHRHQVVKLLQITG